MCSSVTEPYVPGSRVPSRFRLGPLSSNKWAMRALGTHFTEDGGEFNQIESNLAMICATLGLRFTRCWRPMQGAFATRSAAWEGAARRLVTGVQLPIAPAPEKIGAA